MESFNNFFEEQNIRLQFQQQFRNIIADIGLSILSEVGICQKLAIQLTKKYFKFTEKLFDLLKVYSNIDICVLKNIINGTEKIF